MAEDGTLDSNLEGGGEGEPSLRDDIASAFDQIETRDAPPAPDKGAPATPPPTAGMPGERARGPDGRFAPGDAAKPPEKAPSEPAAAGETPAAKPGQAPPQKPAAPAAGAPPAGQEPAPAVRPPASWKPAAREHWSKLPAEVQQEVARRETEVGRALQESAKARDALGHVQQVLAPYAANIQASGADAVTAIGNFFRADNTLRHGSSVDKAQMVADIIKNYGVDVQALDHVLAGLQVAPDPNEAVATRLRAEMQQQLQPVLGFFNQMQGQREQMLSQVRERSGSEVRSFGEDGAHEFFEDVRVDMADIIDLYTARNQPITLQEAYDRAIMINPSVREIVAKRAEAEKVNAQAQAAQRARRTAASIGGSPAPHGSPGPAGGDSRRAEIEAAWEASSGSS